MKFYSVDRGRKYASGKTLELQPFRFWSRSNTIGHIQAHSPLLDYAQTKFSNGISQFGLNYSSMVDSRVCDNNSLNIDLLLELTRLAYFPQKPSRLQSIFACETLKEAAHFRGESKISVDTPIYEINCEKSIVHRGDMALFWTGCTAIEVEYRLHLYWEGKTDTTLVREAKWEIVIPLPVQIGQKVEE